MQLIIRHREKELKNYVISNILLVTLLSGTFNADIIKNLKGRLQEQVAHFPNQAE